MTDTNDHKLDPMRVGFAVLCPLRNLGGFKTTVRTIRGSFPGQQVVGVLGADATDEEIREFSRDAKTAKAGTSITSMINLGARSLQSDWICFLDAGTIARPAMFRNHRQFGPRDIMYRVVNRRHHFGDASIDGLVVNRQTYEDVGDMNELEGSMELVKTFWALDAIERGCRFVALVGVRL